MKRLTALLAASVALTAPAAAPASAETIFEDDFETGTLERLGQRQHRLICDHQRPGTREKRQFSLESTIPEGPGWGEINQWFMPGYDETYVRFDVTFEDGFRNLRGAGTACTSHL